MKTRDNKDIKLDMVVYTKYQPLKTHENNRKEIKWTTKLI